MPKSLNQILNANLSVWYARTDGLLRLVLSTQLGAAQRNFEPISFWRFAKEDTQLDPLRGETLLHERKYFTPIPAFFYIEFGAIDKPLTREGVTPQSEQQIKIDLAEAMRLGEKYGVIEPIDDFYFLLPAPNDVYQWNNSLYVIEEVRPELYYAPLRRYVVWQGKASLFRTDATAINEPLQADAPLKIFQPTWVK